MNAASYTTSRIPYPSDLSDEQWALIADLIPAPNPHPNFPKAIYPRREIVNAILSLLRTGCPWRHLPHDFPTWQLVASYYYKWKAANILDLFVSSASVQDRDGAVPLIHAARESFPSIEKILVDGADMGEVINDAASATGITVEVTKRDEQVKGFVPAAKRWSVERTLGWLGRYRRTRKDYERYSETEEDVIKWAMVALLLRRLAPGHPLETPRLQIRD
jgi:transposase